MNDILVFFAYVLCIIGVVVNFGARFWVKVPKAPAINIENETDDEAETYLEDVQEKIDHQTKRLLIVKAFGLWVLIAGVILLFVLVR